MTTGHIIQTAIEIAICLGFVIGFCNEDKVARWERNIWCKMRRHFRCRKVK